MNWQNLKKIQEMVLTLSPQAHN